MAEKNDQYGCMDDYLDRNDMHHREMHVKVNISGRKFSSVTNWSISRHTRKDI